METDFYLYATNILRWNNIKTCIKIQNYQAYQNSYNSHLTIYCPLCLKAVHVYAINDFYLTHYQKEECLTQQAFCAEPKSMLITIGCGYGQWTGAAEVDVDFFRIIEEFKFPYTEGTLQNGYNVHRKLAWTHYWQCAFIQIVLGNRKKVRGLTTKMAESFGTLIRTPEAIPVMYRMVALIHNLNPQKSIDQLEIVSPMVVREILKAWATDPNRLFTETANVFEAMETLITL